MPEIFYMLFAKLIYIIIYLNFDFTKDIYDYYQENIPRYENIFLQINLT